MDITVRKVDEVFLEVSCNRGVGQEIREYFSFYAHNYKYMPLYKNKMWDGKIYLFRDGKLYLGLLPRLYEFAKDNGYSINNLGEFESGGEVGEVDIQGFIDSLNLPFQPRDYQIKSLEMAIRNKRILLLSPTGSGKSYSLYLIIRYLQKFKMKGLLLVPTVSLVTQMFKDFESYGWDAERYCHMIYSGQEKDSDKFLNISTWQSIFKMPKKTFQGYDFLVVDECLHPDSIITMGDGMHKKIKDIQVGDIVLTINDTTKKQENRPVKYIHKNISKSEQMFKVTLDNTTIKITGNHKVRLTNGKWKRVDELNIGDDIQAIE